MLRRHATHASTWFDGYRLIGAGAWRLRLGLLMLVTMVGLSAAPTLALAGDAREDFIVEGGGLRADGALAPFATIALDNGDGVSFTGSPDERGRTAGVLVTEGRSAGRGSLRSIPALAAANPLEIFNALAKPGQGVPKILVELYARDATLGQQGWARDLAAETQPQGEYCPWAGDWGDDLDAYADAFNDDPFTSTWDGPNTKPEHWGTVPGPGLGGLQNKELNGQANDVTAFYSSTLYCVEDYENAATYQGQYIGNYASIHFRPAGHGTWIHSQTVQLDEVGDRLDHLYFPANPFSPSAAKYDFHLTITQAKPADQFHIGATWVYGGPSDYKSAN